MHRDTATYLVRVRPQYLGIAHDKEVTYLDGIYGKIPSQREAPVLGSGLERVLTSIIITPMFYATHYLPEYTSDHWKSTLCIWKQLVSP